MRHLVYILLLSLIIIGCKKETPQINQSNVSLKLISDVFTPNKYLIQNLLVTSTNDTVINDGRIRIIDSLNGVLADDTWRNFLEYTIKLTEPVEYNINFNLYHISGGREVLDATTNANLDNRVYPKYLKLNSAEMTTACLEDGFYGEEVSSTFGTFVYINQKQLDIFDDEDTEYDTPYENLTFFERVYSPKKLSFNFTDLKFPVRTLQNNSMRWMYYQVYINYPLAIGSSFIEYRDIRFNIDLQELYYAGNNEAGVEYSIVNEIRNTGDPDYGEIKIEWIYE